MANENIKVISDREDIVAIADNIRSLTGITGELTLAEMATAKGSGGGVSLPSLANPGTKEDLMLNKELIDQNGNKVTGTFTIDEEVDTQTDLISQIKTKVNSLPDAGSGESANSFPYTITVNHNMFSSSDITIFYDTNTLSAVVTCPSIMGLGTSSISGAATLMETLIGAGYCFYMLTSIASDVILTIITENPYV